MKKTKVRLLPMFTLILGIILGFIIIYASVALQSSDILYDNTNSKLNSITLQNAMDELYNKAKVVKNECPSGYTCESVIKAVSGTGENIGDEVCIGDECFYVISNNGTTTEMLAKYNLYVGNICASSSSCTAILSGDSKYGKQNSDAIGYYVETNEWYTKNGNSLFPCIGTTAFGTSSPASYETSTVKTYVDNYVNYLKNTYNVNVSGTLITFSQLISLGCDGASSSHTCMLSGKSWLYSTSYWTQTLFSSSEIWRVTSGGDFYGYSYAAEEYFGVRPVITVSSL